MNLGNVLMSLLIFSAMAVGLGSFYIGTAAEYSFATSEITEFENTFNKYSDINSKLLSLEQAVTKVNVLNPLTWGNVVSVIINVVLIMADVPGMFNGVITDMVAYSGFMPEWVIPFVEGAILLVVIFAGLKMLTSGGGDG